MQTPNGAPPRRRGQHESSASASRGMTTPTTGGEHRTSRPFMDDFDDVAPVRSALRRQPNPPVPQSGPSPLLTMPTRDTAPPPPPTDPHPRADARRSQQHWTAPPPPSSDDSDVAPSRPSALRRNTQRSAPAATKAPASSSSSSSSSRTTSSDSEDDDTPHSATIRIMQSPEAGNNTKTARPTSNAFAAATVRSDVADNRETPLLASGMADNVAAPEPDEDEMEVPVTWSTRLFLDRAKTGASSRKSCCVILATSRHSSQPHWETTTHRPRQLRPPLSDKPSLSSGQPSCVVDDAARGLLRIRTQSRGQTPRC
jgi:hypothetical protein